MQGENMTDLNNERLINLVQEHLELHLPQPDTWKANSTKLTVLQFNFYVEFVKEK